MALPAALTGPWNPFRITGTAMPPNLLLMCKVLAVALLATGHVRILPDPFLPFIPGLDQLMEPWLFRASLQTVVVVSALALLFNRWVRASALVLGACMLLAVVSSKAYYGNNKTFVGLALVLAGLSDFDRPAYLLRWQLALVYFGAALNKLLDPDWQSGLFFDYWAGTQMKHEAYLAVADLLPPLVAGQIMCWGTIVAEFAIAAGVLVAPLIPLALWINALFQVGLLQFTGNTFTLFFYGMNAVALAFIVWPRRIEVLYRGQSPGMWRWLRWLDPDGVQHWQGGMPEGSTARFLVRDGSREYRGVFAGCRLLLYSPVFWLIATAALALLPGSADWARRGLVGGVLVLVMLAFVRKTTGNEPVSEVPSSVGCVERHAR
jgi:hypothetical protein